jgi:GNAT superfamily N-acetyltransferase
MNFSDIPLGITLKRAAGWNQTEADWRRFLTLSPEGCFVAELDGKGVGTVAAFVFGNVAWIAMVLVSPDARGQGLGTKLMSHALTWLESRSVACIRLDATPLGQPIYEKLGFKAEYKLNRFEGVLPSIVLSQTDPLISPVGTPAELDDCLNLDQTVTGTPRQALIKALHADEPGNFYRYGQGKAAGYIAYRPGENATFLGPCCAISQAAGNALLYHAARINAGRRVFIDVPLDNQPAVEVVNALGLKPQRPLLRMCKGTPVTDFPACIWATTGPEKG